MKKIITIAMISLFLGCTSLMDISSYKVNHSDYESIENPFSIDSVKIYRDILYTISVLKWDTKDVDYYTIDIDYSGSSWLFLDGNVTIQADEHIIKINDKKPYRRTRNGGVNETVSAYISDEDLEKIATASMVKMEFFGSPVDISELGKSFIQQFVDEY
jgi:hypothetical protein